MCRTLKLTLAYDGTRFVGWQRQADGISIQGLLEDALARFEGPRSRCTAPGGRMPASMRWARSRAPEITASHSVDVVARALNACLPPEIRVTSVEQAADDFHARFSARSKTYRYVIRNAPIVSPFERAYVWHIPDALDRDAMQEAAGDAGRDARLRGVPERRRRRDDHDAGR